LAELGPEALEAVPSLLQALKRPENHSIHFEIAQSLGEIGSVAAVPALEELLKDSDGMIRLQAAVSLEKIRPTDTWPAPAVVEALRSDSRTLRGMAAGALCEIDRDASDAVATLETMTHEGYWDLRVDAAAALGCIGPAAASAMPTVKSLAATDPEPLVRRVAVVAMAAIEPQSPEAVGALTSALQSEEYLVRGLAAHALGRREATSTTLMALERALKDESLEVRAEAARSLGRIGSAAAQSTPALREALNDKQPRVRRAAADALKRTTGSKRPQS
jgi:HEAT repeat protein